MSYKIVFLDIDGTLLQPDHSICPTTKQAINELHDRGIHVFLATGRPNHAIFDLASELRINSYISYNGAYANFQNNVIIDEPFDRKIVAKFVQIAKRLGHELVLYTSGNNYFTSPNSKSTKEFKHFFKLDNNDLFIEDTTPEVFGITIMNMTPDQLTEYTFDPYIYLSQLNIVGFEHCYDVIRKHVNKGSAAKTVLKQLGIPAKKAVAFGDGLNDKELFQAVGTSFAMGNCHQDVLQYANYQTTSNRDAGIYKGLRKLDLME